MNNFEKWHDLIARLKWDLAVVDGKPCDCDSILCEDCDFNGNTTCITGKWLWLWGDHNETTTVISADRE